MKKKATTEDDSTLIIIGQYEKPLFQRIQEYLNKSF